MSRAPSRKQREQLPTMLIMGEGFAEVALLKHLRLLFLPRGAGLALTIDNAHGKGAKNVVNKAIAKSRVFAYDHVWVLLDTDTDYDERLVSEAKKKKIQIAACNPCLEAALLQIKGVQAAGQSADIKHQFEKRFGMPAHQAEVYAAHFGLKVLESAPGKESPVGSLIQAMLAACMKT
jgi:hypothetical protein